MIGFYEYRRVVYVHMRGLPWCFVCNFKFYSSQSFRVLSGLWRELECTIAITSLKETLLLYRYRRTKASVT